MASKRAGERVISGTMAVLLTAVAGYFVLKDRLGISPIIAPGNNRPTTSQGTPENILPAANGPKQLDDFLSVKGISNPGISSELANYCAKELGINHADIYEIKFGCIRDGAEVVQVIAIVEYGPGGDKQLRTQGHVDITSTQSGMTILTSLASFGFQVPETFGNSSGQRRR